jgi:AcrR family transcriptional regulator
MNYLICKLDRSVYFCIVTKAEKTKEFIIAKAAPLFNKKGYAGTSMSDIMKATGLAKGGLYGNFESKDEIAALAFEYSYNQLKEDIGQKVRAKKTGVEKLLTVLQYHKNYTVSSPIDGGCPLMNTAIDADDSATRIDERPAGVARIERRISLNDVVHEVSRDASQRAA